MVLPRRLRDIAGVTEGTLMKVDVIEGPRFLVTPQLTIDRPLVAGPKRSRKEVLKELAAAVADLRQDAQEKGLDKMPMREIRAAVTAARRDLKAGKQPAK
ncbi:hypothetical protein SBA3_650005 [Candidatus Sulfopaludibacter sp. SbA3]|nr:hypothetical protein SBA3_650005 [Candidatus Sulfopaludibacter sp. SbA3]